MYKCELTIVLDYMGSEEVFSEERVSDDPTLGLSLLLRQGMERLSLKPGIKSDAQLDITLLGWVSPMLSMNEINQARQEQLRQATSRNESKTPF